MPERRQRPLVRILVYLAAIILVAAGYLAYGGTSGLTPRNVVVAIPFAILFAVLIWLRWDVAPRVARERKARADCQLSGRSSPAPSEKT